MQTCEVRRNGWIESLDVEVYKPAGSGILNPSKGHVFLFHRMCIILEGMGTSRCVREEYSGLWQHHVFYNSSLELDRTTVHISTHEYTSRVASCAEQLVVSISANGT